MRHQKSGRALGVKPAHRRAMLRNLVTSLLEHEQITTTVARAKELRGPLDKMITLGKKGDLSARRKALTFVKSKKAMEVLFGAFAERYAERPGGYCRVVRTSVRKGDGAEMAIVQLVDAPNDALAEAQKPASRRGGARGGRRARKAEAAHPGAQAATSEEKTPDAQAQTAPSEEEAGAVSEAETAGQPAEDAAPEETAETATEAEAVAEETAETPTEAEAVPEAAGEAGPESPPAEEAKKEEKED